MIQITIAQTTVKEFKGNSKTTGKPYHLRMQTGYAHTVDKDGNKPPYPEKFDLMLDGEQQPYSPGDYQLHPSSLYVDRDGRLAVSARLAPVARKPATA
ncbi:heavy metal transporter [Paucibacter aquatile]|uniref:Single-stranded DNA-binding protein n=1 Tax=Kinneretia aquatilis TaxID=2070761 RepID=A0A2N8KTC5_9BURK|nr:single-stranded DNA-binding protein [Paucibacter aquatile]PND36612.1 heavy metal transporter [Paucibacter aquatile]PND36699.1 heavy metal transporter [Paucibacter aquatile]PND36704.1 heavy metal transporter [Paucibacter aquatile]PND36710.1 heavy metal transporter [Paucibacter aquatile]PND36716.1 heavy metal transporter [Paucibacter aquatile]